MNTLEKVENHKFPFKWVNLDSYTESEGYKLEIYLIEYEDLIEGLISMFYILFREIKSKIQIYNDSWWDYCLDTWNPNEDKYDYKLEGKSSETKDYLSMLEESFIEQRYSGVCKCNNWDRFLLIVLTCIERHQAPYSPIFYSEEHDFFFYFHHTGSMGFYYKVENETVSKILHTAKKEYEIN